MLKPARPAVLGMILKGFPRISETFISNEILLLEKLGFRIRIFSMRQPRESFAHRSVARIRARVDYLPEKILPSLPSLLKANLLLAARIPGTYGRAAQMAFRRFQRTRKSATLKHLLQAGYLVQRLLPGQGIVHLHAHFAHSPTSVAFFSGLLSGLPFSFTAHAKDIYTSDPRQLREKIALARFVITCTQYNRDYLKRLAPGGQTPIDCIYHGIDPRLFAAAEDSGESRGRPEEPMRLLTVARLTAKKGLPTVLETLCRLRDRGVTFEHVLIGDGELRDEILSLIRRWNLTGFTRWLGTQPHDVVLAHYRRAHVFLLGCRIAPNGDRDGIPNVLMEAMAMGVPVVATRVSAIPELVQHRKTGLLVPPEDPEAMTQAVLELSGDPELKKRIVTRARERVLRDFDNQVLIRRLAEHFRAALAEH